MQRHNTRTFNANKFKLGLFAPNCSGGLTMTKAPERWDASWDNNMQAATLADAAGLVISKPKPYGNERPLLMSAGSSKTGRAFAARHADCLFMVIIEQQALAEDIRAARALAAGERRVGVFASGHMICRPTQKEAEEYHHCIVHEMGDWDAVDVIIGVRKDSLSFPTSCRRCAIPAP